MRPHPSPHSRLTAAQTILLACARSELTSEYVRRISAAVAEGIAWDDLWKLACAHGVGYFVGQHLLRLSQSGEIALPAEVESRMRKDLWHISVHAEVLLGSQLRLAEELDRANLPVLWLKGLALSEQLYGRPEARQSIDLDLLAEPEQFPQVEECLLRIGCRRRPSGTPGEEEHTMGVHHSTWSFRISEEQETPIELHQSLGGPACCQPDPAGMMRRSRQVPLQGRLVRAPSLEDELIVLCLHAHHHNFGLMRLWMDVAEYVKKYHSRLDWPKFFELARTSRVQGRVCAALMLADAILGLGVSLPSEVQLTALQRWAVRDVTAADVLDPAADHDQDDFRRVRLALLMDRWSDVARLLGPHLLPSRRYLRAVYPQPWARLPGVARLYHLARIASRFLFKGSGDRGLGSGGRGAGGRKDPTNLMMSDS